MTHLVTGAAGFIGFHLTKLLLDRGNQVIGIDCINDYYDPTLKFARLAELGIDATLANKYGKNAQSNRYPSFSFIRMKLEDIDALSTLFKSRHFDCVVNLAAQAGVRYSIENPRAYLDSNLTGFLNILECCRNGKTGHLIFASSSSVYGLNTNRPFSVHDGTDHPVSLYAASKKANEVMAHSYSHLYGIPTTGLRFFTVYGPWGRPDMAYFKFANAILSGATIDIYNDGDMYRDFTYIDDIVAGIIHVMEKPPLANPYWDASTLDPASSSAPYCLYNIGNNRSERLADFIAELENALGAKAKKRFLPMQAGDVYATEADVSDLKRDFGWTPTTRIREGLAHFADWLRQYKTEIQ